MDKKSKLEKKVRDIRAEIGEIAPKLALMQRTPRYDASYSAAKIGNWQMDLDKLREREREAVEELHNFISTPEYRRAVDEQVQRLTVLTNDLNADAAQLKNRLFEIRNSSPEKILAGDDPLTLAGELLAVKEQIAATGEALSLVKLAFTLITKAPQFDKPRELVKGEASRYRDYLPG